MPYLSVDVEFEVFCSRCGAGLCNQTKAEDAYRTRLARVSVSPCDKCLEQAYDDGYEKGTKQAGGE